MLQRLRGDQRHVRRCAALLASRRPECDPSYFCHGLLEANQLRIALAQIDTTVGDIDGNCALILAHWDRAEREKADLLLVPELALCGYPPLDLLERPQFRKDAARALVELTRRAGKTALLVGTFIPNEESTGKPLYNAAVLLGDRRVLSVARKCLLPTYDVFDEARNFEPAAAPTLVRYRGERLGISICEDLWNDKDFWRARRLYREDPGEALLRRKATLLLNISASPFSEGKPEVRRRMFSRLSRDGKIPIAYVNLVGGNDELVFDGGSLVLDAAGRVVARGALFQEDFLLVDLSREAGYSRTPTPLHGAASPPEERSKSEPLELLRRALVLGIRDYASKCGFRTAVLGLSGGIDSALVAALAVEALGPENVTGLSMPSGYSSPGSIEDARALAGALGIRFEVVSIEPLFRETRETLGSLFAGRAEDVTEENMQSRLRGLLLMSFSNKFGPLVLTTGNKSELAVGYCTLYGDMCGGLAPISDLPKMRVYELARHLNARAGRALIPETTFTKPPSAELRPDQKDQDSLPPYPLLDSVLDALVGQNLSVDMTARKLGAPRPLISRIAMQLDRAEYKRAQAAPGLKVSAKAFGSGRRIPIAQKSRA